MEEVKDRLMEFQELKRLGNTGIDNKIAQHLGGELGAYWLRYVADQGNSDKKRAYDVFGSVPCNESTLDWCPVAYTEPPSPCCRRQAAY